MNLFDLLHLTRKLAAFKEESCTEISEKVESYCGLVSGRTMSNIEP